MALARGGIRPGMATVLRTEAAVSRIPAISSIRTGRWTETLIGRIERATWLQMTARFASRAISKVVRPGAFKDLLSGTWLGHPVHPFLTDVAIGAWTGAVVLDALPIE